MRLVKKYNKKVDFPKLDTFIYNNLLFDDCDEEFTDMNDEIIYNQILGGFDPK